MTPVATAPKATEKAPWELAFERDHAEQPEKPVPEPEKETPTQPEEKPTEPAEETPSEETPEEESTEEDGDEEKPDTGTEKKEEDAPKPAGDEEDDKIRAFAIDNGLTFHDAKAEYVKIKNVMEKYKNDPVQLAKALRSSQTEYDRLRTKTEEERNEEKEFAFSPNPQLEVAQWVNANADKVVEGYRAKNPEQAAEMSDETILKVVYDQTLSNFTRWNEGQMNKIKTEAKTRRDGLLKSLPDKDKRFLPDIKVYLDRMPDTVLLKKGFDFKLIINAAKGQYYDQDIKAAEERAARRASEQPSIIGVSGGSKRASVKKEGQSAAGSLSTFEKKRARDMYPSTMSDEECYKEFLALKNRKKK